MDVNRSLNSVQAPASSGGVHELSAGPRELPKLRESTRIDEVRKKWERGEGRGWCSPLSEADDCCQFSPPKNKRGASPSLSSQLRAYILSRSPPHHDHPQAVLFSPSRNTDPAAPRFPSPLPRFSSPRGIRRLTSREEKRSDWQGQIEEYVLSEGGKKERGTGGGDERHKKKVRESERDR